MLTTLRHTVSTPIKSALRVATGRSAVLHLARLWNPEKVFMPCFVPEGIIRPFAKHTKGIIFYRLDEQLRPDLDYLQTAMSANKSERPLIVEIRYFGWGGHSSELKDIAKYSGGLVFTDCAHCLTADERYADVTLTSLNKFLPVADGATLASYRDDLDVSVADSERLGPLPADALNAYMVHLGCNKIIDLTGPEEDISAVLQKSEDAYNEYYRHISEDMELRAQSAHSRAVEATAQIEIMQMFRWAQSKILTETINAASIVRDATCEFAFPIRCRGRREEIARQLLRIGVIPGSLTDRWDHVPSEGFDVEREFIHDHLLLPIGQTEIHMLNAMANIVDRWG